MPDKRDSESPLHLSGCEDAVRTLSRNQEVQPNQSPTLLTPLSWTSQNCDLFLLFVSHPVYGTVLEWIEQSRTLYEQD